MESLIKAIKPLFSMFCIVAVVGIAEHRGADGLCYAVGIAALAGLGGYSLKEALSILKGGGK